MEQIYCMNCLRQTPAYPCPLCGYDPSDAPQVTQALEQSILHGRYLTGRALEKNNFEIVYRGLDLSQNRPVTIWEFFPAAQASRQQDGSLSWATPLTEDPEAILARVRQRIPQAAIADSFSENGTVYIVCKPAPARPLPPAQPKKKESEWLPPVLALLFLCLAVLTGVALWWGFGSLLL